MSILIKIKRENTVNKFKEYGRFMTLFCLSVIFTTQVFAQTNRVRPETKHLIFKSKAVIDPASESVINDAFIEINNGKILRIGRISDLEVPEGAEVKDYGEKYIIPGLIDTHGHLYGGIVLRHTTYPDLAPLFLAAGVTTVRNPGSEDPDSDLGLQHRINSGRYFGPRYFNSGPYIEGVGERGYDMNPVTTKEEVRLKIDQWVQKGATSIKIFSALKKDLFKTAVEHGHAYGIKVTAHSGAVSLEEAIKMGVDELFHGVYASPELKYWDTEIKDGRELHKKISDVNPDTPEFKRVLKLAAQYGTVLSPTVALDDQLDFNSDFILDQKKYLTPEAWETVKNNVDEELAPYSKKLLEKNILFIKLAHEAGCILTIGSDRTDLFPLPGYSMWHEMAVFKRAGLSEMEVLKAATYNGAYVIGRTDLLGSLSSGKLADFVVLDKNPLEDIWNVKFVHSVVKDGVEYEPDKLLEPVLGKIQ